MIIVIILTVCAINVSSFKQTSLSRYYTLCKMSDKINEISKCVDDVDVVDVVDFVDVVGVVDDIVDVVDVVDVVTDDIDFVEPLNEDKEFFGPTKRVRLGRSRDQDGKSNVWSIEPRMEVEEVNKNEEEVNINVKVGGLALSAVVIALPVFLALSKILPDPSDF